MIVRILLLVGLLVLPTLSFGIHGSRWVSIRDCPEIIIRRSDYLPGYPYCRCLRRHDRICTERGRREFKREQERLRQDIDRENLNRLLDIIQPHSSSKETPE